MQVGRAKLKAQQDGTTEKAQDSSRDRIRDAAADGENVRSDQSSSNRAAESAAGTPTGAQISASASKSPRSSRTTRNFFRGSNSAAAPTLIESLYSSVRGSGAQGSPTPSPGGPLSAPTTSSDGSKWGASLKQTRKATHPPPAPGFPRLSRSHGVNPSGSVSGSLPDGQRNSSGPKMTMADFDHLALLRALSIRLSARLSLHQFSRSKVSALLTPQTAWDSYYVELRGGLVAFFLDERISWGSPTRLGSAGGDNRSQGPSRKLSPASARDSRGRVMLRSASSETLEFGARPTSASNSISASGRLRPRQRARSSLDVKLLSTSHESGGMRGPPDLEQQASISSVNSGVVTGKRADESSAGLKDSDRCLVGIFSVMGCVIKRKKGAILKLRKGSNYGPLALRFSSEAECNDWERELRALADTPFLSLSDFDAIAAIGKGASAKVFLVTERSNGSRLALKVIDKESMYVDSTAFRHVVDERLALEIVRGEPYFVQLKHAFQTRRALYLATEFCEGGDMHQLLRKRGALSLNAARLLFAQIVLALESLHLKHIVYRDLKPENVLLDNDGCARLADLGLCKKLSRCSPTPLTSTVCGTFSYAAPEMLAMQDYGFGVDFWSLGVLLYQAVHAELPFSEAELKALGHASRETGSNVDVQNKRRTSVKEGGELLALMEDIDKSLIVKEGSGESEEGQGLKETGDEQAKEEKRENADPVVKNGNAQEKKTHNYESVPVALNFGPGCDRDFRDLVRGLLTPSPTERFGCGPKGMQAVKSHPFFASIDWKALSTRALANDEIRDYARSGDARDLLRNFDTEITGAIHLDEDEDDMGYGDIGLWPPSKAKRQLEADPMLAGFSFSEDVYVGSIGSRSSTLPT